MEESFDNVVLYDETLVLEVRDCPELELDVIAWLVVMDVVTGAKSAVIEPGPFITTVVEGSVALTIDIRASELHEMNSYPFD